MKIDVVYLAYFNENAGYKMDIVEDFLNSYKKFDAGIEHSLVIATKNCSSKEIYNKLFIFAQENNAQILDVPNTGWDIGTYFRAANNLNSDYILFLGSTSIILSENWLEKIYKPFISDEKVQLAGAMGSWETGITGLFPNPHIRTCSFMIKRELFLEYIENQKFPVTKEDTYEIEHGKTSITNFILKKGYKAVVVNNEGDWYTPENWFFSKTFRHPDGCKTLISDKQLMLYLAGAKPNKILLEDLAWGIHGPEVLKTVLGNEYHC